MLLAALLHRLPRDVPSRFLLLVRPDTVLRWHRDALARRPAARSRPKTSTVWEILHQAGIDPAPARAPATWASFLRPQAGALLACDFSGDRYLNRSPPVRAGGHRAHHPPDTHPGRNPSSHRTLGRPGREEVAFPRFMLAMKLFAAGAKIDADDIVLLYRQLGLTTLDEGLDLAEQAYPGRPVPARFDSCLPRLWTPAAVSLSREDQVAARSRWHLPGPSGRPLPKTWDAGA